MTATEDTMPDDDDDRIDRNDLGGVIRARDNVVVTAAVEPRSGRRVYYVKVVDTGEIFEFGEEEYEIWRSFEGGASLDAASQRATRRFGQGFQERFKGFVADLATRGLIGGDLPPDLVEDYRQDAQTRWQPFLIDPAGGERKAPPHSPFRFVLGDPNRFFGFLARNLAFLRYARWPLAIAGVVSLLVLFKHAQFYSLDFRALMTQWGRIPHAVFTLFTINLTRVVAQGAVSRYYGARVRYMSIDLVYGVWPRFHEDKKGILLLERTPQLWSHSTPFFVRLGFFSVGTLGWWWFRGNGAYLSGYFLLMSQAALIDFATATLPLFKNETYFWFCAFNRDPLLQDRGKAALRSMFLLPKGLPSHLSSIEKLALSLYGLSMAIAFILVILTLITFAVGLTGTYYGFGFVVCMVMLMLGIAKMMTIRSLKRRLLAQRAARQVERKAQRREARRPVLAMGGE
jgi:hypothetical protein